MCKILTPKEKESLNKLTRLVESLTKKKVILESKPDCHCCDKKPLKENTHNLNKRYSVYELMHGQPTRFWNEIQNNFTYEVKNATLYTKEEAKALANKLLQPRIEKYQKDGKHYSELHIGDLFEKGMLKEEGKKYAKKKELIVVPKPKEVFKETLDQSYSDMEDLAEAIINKYNITDIGVDADIRNSILSIGRRSDKINRIASILNVGVGEIEVLFSDYNLHESTLPQLKKDLELKGDLFGLETIDILKIKVLSLQKVLLNVIEFLENNIKTMKESKQGLKEGVWALPKDAVARRKAMNFKQELQRIKNDIYDIAGSDELFDRLDGAITELDNLITAGKSQGNL